MQFLRGDPEAYQDILDEVDPELLPPGAAEHRPSGEYVYESSEAQFDSRKLEKNSRITRDALLAIGATTSSVKAHAIALLEDAQ